MIIEISEYAKQKGISRQAARNRKGKKEDGVIIELAIFVEYKGEKIQVGTKKFIELPEINKD